MATVTPSAIDDILRLIASSMPGAQEGESIVDYRARVNQRLMEIVDAVADHRRRVEAFIDDRSDAKLEPADQFYNAVRQRFIPDEFGA